MDNTGSKIQASAHFFIDLDGTFRVGAMTGIKSITTTIPGAIDVEFLDGVVGKNSVVHCTGDATHPTQYRVINPELTAIRIDWAGGPTFPRYIDLTVLFVGAAELVNAGTIIAPP